MRLPPQIDHELPWGYWLRLERSEGRPDLFFDPDGGEWNSLREAFWFGRLGMPAGDGGPHHDILEILLVILLNLSRANSSESELLFDAFGGNHAAARLFGLWMRSLGLIAPKSPGGSGLRSVTPEGWSAMLMLGATRPQPVRAMRPGGVSVRTLATIGMGPMNDDARMREIEEGSAGWPTAFQRRDVGKRFAIVLVKRDVDAPVPVARTAWSQTFTSERDRDMLYDWICRRVDRWEAWSDLAWGDGGAKLTSHLLSLVLLSEAG
ncbi:hypothetical protein [uncultured Sphingomonas sp.]|uniref:hypothetical protein n=1 Tax=uncultured Sphingomonas sp. TaxID=158754 RepID=UPI002595984F|nr:hypothetical protein [uncultured Sphingomonas sp.]